MKKTSNMSRDRRRRANNKATTTPTVLVKAVKETRVVLFGSASDPEVQQSIEKVKVTRTVELKARPDFDSGNGPCGKQLCHCKGVCNRDINGAFAGDLGAMTGTGY